LVAFASTDRDDAALYRIMTSVIVPRPIAFTATRDAAGQANLAPFSFFNMVTATPPTLAVSIGSRRGRPKDSAANILATGEFVVHVVSETLLPAMNITSADFAPDVDEFSAAGLTPLPATLVKAPRIAEAAVALECRLVKALELGRADRRTYHFIGEVIYLHIDDGVLTDDSLAPLTALAPVGRMGRGEYVRTSDRLRLPAPVLTADGAAATTELPRSLIP
jgi:flavin reductase (DIM6/NTAB) family NADH-FMN oxidoreductase RutF